MTNYTPEDLKALPELDIKGYVTTVLPLAQEIETETGIYHIIPIVQSSHESRQGNSGLARNHCNLFGIVATDHWKQKNGAICSMPTFEYINGNRIDTTREFRAYPSWMDSFKDWVSLMTGLSIYRNAYEFMKQGASGVRDAIDAYAPIYATDPQYAKSLTDMYQAVTQVLGVTQ